MNKPRLFIGSSIEGLNIAYAIQENLTHSAEVTVWDQGVFKLSDTTIESLMTVIENCDFGVFVFTPDDILNIRGKRNSAIRDNVLFELGLFIGKIGRTRSFIVMPENVQFHLPTDLLGISPGKYETTRSDGNFKAGTGSLSNKIRDAINKLGFIASKENQADTAVANDREQKPENEDWIENIFIKKNYEEGIKILKKKNRYSKKEDDKVTYQGYICYCELQLDFRKGISKYINLVQKYPKNNIAYKVYARALMDSNNFEDALKLIENGLIQCERKLGLTAMKADCFWLTNKKSEAIETLNKSTERTDSLIAAKLASYYAEDKDYVSAISIAKAGYKNNPKDAELLSSFAQIAFDATEYDLSTFLYNELVSVTPKNQSAWCMLGNSFYHKDLFNSALYAYEKANELANDKEAWILENIGNLHLQRGFFNKAELFLNDARKIHEKSEYGLARLSDVYKSIEEEKKKINEIMVIGKAKLFADQTSIADGTNTIRI